MSEGKKFSEDRMIEQFDRNKKLDAVEAAKDPTFNIDATRDPFGNKLSEKGGSKRRRHTTKKRRRATKKRKHVMRK